MKRVGVRQWLILGILAQMPAGGMYTADLVKCANACLPGVSVSEMLSRLKGRKLVSYRSAVDAWMITDMGLSAQCERTRVAHVPFYYVPSYMVMDYIL